MDGIDLEDRSADSTTRRTVVKAGVKLAYAAPIVAASFTLRNARAQATISGGNPNPEPPISWGCNPQTCAAQAQGNACITCQCQGVQECVCTAQQCPPRTRCCPSGNFAGQCRRGACPG